MLRKLLGYGRIKLADDFSNLLLKFNVLITDRFNSAIQAHYQKHFFVFDFQPQRLRFQSGGDIEKNHGFWALFPWKGL